MREKMDDMQNDMQKNIQNDVQNNMQNNMQNDVRFYLGVSGIFALADTVCLHKNPAGITFPFFVLATALLLAVVVRRQGMRLKRATLACFAGMLLLGVSVCLTVNTFFQVCNHIGIMLLLALAVFCQYYETSSWGTAAYLLNGMLLIGDWFASMGRMFRHMAAAASDAGSSKRRGVSSILLGGGLAVLFLLVVMPLLLGSDLVFAEMFHSLWRDIDVADGVFAVCRFAIGFWLFYTSLAAVARRGLRESLQFRVPQASAVTGISFLAVLTAVYLLYCGVQGYSLLLCGGNLPRGVTYAEYVHTGFYQLVAVTVINMVTIGLCAKLFRESRLLQALLLTISVCTCFMGGFAAYRMLLYIRAYHLTFLRIFVLWILAVIVCLMAGLIIYIFRRGFPFCRYGIAVVATAYILFAFIPMDYVIASYNVTHDEELTYADLQYLTGLSVDAAPVLAGLSADDIALDRGMDSGTQNRLAYGRAEEETRLAAEGGDGSGYDAYRPQREDVENELRWYFEDKVAYRLKTYSSRRQWNLSLARAKRSLAGR